MRKKPPSLGAPPGAPSRSHVSDGHGPTVAREGVAFLGPERAYSQSADNERDGRHLRRRASGDPCSKATLGPLDTEALARMCRALAHEGRLKLYRRIAAAGSDGVDAAEIGGRKAVGALVAAGLVEADFLGQTTTYRADRETFVRCLALLASPEGQRRGVQ